MSVEMRYSKFKTRASYGISASQLQPPNYNSLVLLLYNVVNHTPLTSPHESLAYSESAEEPEMASIDEYPSR